MVVYSYLATLNNTKKFKEYLELYKDIVLDSIIKLKEKSNEFLMEDLRLKIIENFSIEIPIILIEKIIKTYIHTDKVAITKDGAILLKDGIMFDYEENLESSRYEISLLEEEYLAFLRENNYPESGSIYDLIDFYKVNILDLDSIKDVDIHEYSLQIKFLRKIQNDIEMKDVFRKVLWGSVITKCLFSSEISEGSFKGDILLLDTNFVISLLGLHTESSNRTCQQLIEKSTLLGFEFKIFDQTLEEAKKLIRDTAETLKNNPSISEIFANDITRSCNSNPMMTPTEMERIADNIVSEINKVCTFKVEQIERLRDRVERLDLYRYYVKDLKKDAISAFHDAAAIFYVSNCRGGIIRKVEDAKCWFVQDRKNRTNSLRNKENNINERISSHDLLLLVWMSSPKELDFENVSENEFQKLIAIGQTMDKKQIEIIKQFEKNLKLYADKDISVEDRAKLHRRVISLTVDEIDQINSDDNIVFNENLRETIKQQNIEEMEIRNAYESEIDEFEKKLVDSYDELEQLKEKNSNQTEKLLDLEKKIFSTSEKTEIMCNKLSNIIDENNCTIQTLEKRNADLEVVIKNINDTCELFYSRLTFIISGLLLILIGLIGYVIIRKPNSWTLIEGVIAIATVFGFIIQMFISKYNKHTSKKINGLTECIIMLLHFIMKTANIDKYTEYESNLREIERINKENLKNTQLLSVYANIT